MQSVWSDWPQIFEGKVREPFREILVDQDGRTDAGAFPGVCEKCGLNLEWMQKGARIIEGEKDFSALSNHRYSDPVRHVKKISILPLLENRLCITVKGNAFLYKMVRNIVGTLVYIGQGKILLSDLPQILSSRSRSLAGMTAPAHGLCLYRIFY
jgi:tRNA pseudouridine38-40 synthase